MWSSSAAALGVPSFMMGKRSQIPDRREMSEGRRPGRRSVLRVSATLVTCVGLYKVLDEFGVPCQLGVQLVSQAATHTPRLFRVVLIRMFVLVTTTTCPDSRPSIVVVLPFLNRTPPRWTV